MKNLAVFCACLGCVFTAATSHAFDLKQSKVTQVVNEVQIVSAADQTQKAAAVNDILAMPDLLRTGAASRAELVAQDQTVTRVGANTIFSFDPANRTLDLKQGSLLFHSQHGKGGGTIHTGSATASVLGTTLIITTTPNGGFKVLALEGHVEVKLLNGLKQKLAPGQMTFILPGASQLAPVIIFRLDELIKNSLLVNGFDQALDSAPLIEAQVQKQLKLLRSGKLTDTGYYAGDDASPSQVEVLDINTISHAQRPLTADTADATINQPSLTDASIPTPPNHVFANTLFSIAGNRYFAGYRFTGFEARNIFVNTFPGRLDGSLMVDLSPYSSLSAFDLVAANNFYIEGPVIFRGPSEDTTLGLIAGNQFVLTPGISIRADVHDFLIESPSTLTLNNVSLYNLFNNVFLQLGTDVSFQNNALADAAGGLYINVGHNISATDSELICNTALLTSFRGAITFDSAALDAAGTASLIAPVSISLNNSTINAGSSLLVSSRGNLNLTGTTESGSSLISDPASGSVTLSSSGGSVNVSGTSITAHYLTLNSGDGILLDGSGHAFTASGPGATASFTASSSITVNNADFSSFALLNMAAKTIVLASDTLAPISNFGTQTGQVNVNGPEVYGGLNLFNCTWQNTPVTSAGQVTLSSGPGNEPGIYSYALK